MKLIELTQDRVAIVDDEDFEWLSQWKWHCHRGIKTRYSARTDHSKPQPQLVYMHIVVMKRHKRWKHGKEVDHVNTCGCDNRKENLRVATLNGQRANIRLKSNNTSGITGVRWDKHANKWRAFIRVEKKQKHLGCFINIDDAIIARHRAEIKYFGEFQYDPSLVCPLAHTGQCPECAAKLERLQHE